MENFGKFKDWLLNLLALGIIAGLVSIKNDLSEIKSELPLFKYRLEQLENKGKDNEKKNSDQDKEMELIKNMLVPERTTIKTEKKHND